MPDPGAVANGLKEYQLTLEIATKTALELAGQYDVIFTRTGPEGLSPDEVLDLAARCRIANASKPDLLLSFHFNAGGGNGPEVYIKVGADPKTTARAKILYDGLAALYGYGRGVKEKNFYILRNTEAPAILLELGFIDSKLDAVKIEDPSFRAEMARTLATTLRKIFGGGKMKFKDVRPERWSAKSIERVTALGLMGGYPDGSFKPEQPLSREQLASVMDRYMFMDGIFIDILPWVMPSVVEIENSQKSIGSGSCIARTPAASYILTNYHVVKDAFKLIVYQGNNAIPADIVICDVFKDLALIKVDKELEPMTIADKGPILGEPVAVIGSALALRGSVTVGIISALDRQGGKWYQTDAPINPGNSGGPIINERGELVAVAVAKTVGPDVDNIGYGIKLDLIKQFLQQVKDKIV